MFKCPCAACDALRTRQRAAHAALHYPLLTCTAVPSDGLALTSLIGARQCMGRCIRPSSSAKRGRRRSTIQRTLTH